MKTAGPIRQPWLTLARAAWVVLAAYNALPGLLGIPAYYRQLSALDPWPNTAGWTQSTFSAVVARAGLAPQLVAWLILLPDLVKAVVFLGTGLLVFWRRSDGWLGLLVSYVLVGLCGTFFGDRFQFVTSLPGLWSGVAQVVGVSIWLAFFLFLVIFPDGRFSPPWARWLGVSLPVWFAATEIPTLATGSTPDWISFLGFPLVALTLAAQVQRYRRFSSPVERQQVRWFVTAVGVFMLYAVLDLLARTLFPLPDPPGVANLYLYLAGNLFVDLIFLSIPLAIAVAIFRYRLWDIDLVIRRTLQYTALTLLLGWVYFGGVLLLQGVFTALTGQGSPLAVVLSTLLVAALFEPVRRRVKGLIDRRFYRQRYDAAQSLEGFVREARSQADLDQLSTRLVGTVRETVQPQSVSLWLRKEGLRR